MRLLALALTLLLLPAAATAERFRQRAGRAFGMASVMPAQVWRLPTLTLDQRKQLRALQESLVRDVAGGRGDRAALRGRLARLEDDVKRIVGEEQFARARSMPRGPLVVEELLYYPAASLPDLPRDRKEKLASAFAAVRAGAPSEPVGGLLGRVDRDDPEKLREREMAREGQKVRVRALFEALEALLTRDQMAVVADFLPDRAQRGAFRPQNVARLTSLTMEQEARTRAIFAAFDDETAADRARRDALNKELRGSSDASAAFADANRRTLREERRQVESRIEARANAAYEQLGKVLTPDQMKELESSIPGPQRSSVFAPENVASLSLTAEQQHRLRGAMQSFRRGTADARSDARDLRDDVKGDLKAMEMAPVRDKLRKAASVIDAGRDKVVETLVDMLTAEQFGQLVRHAVDNPRGQRPAAPARGGSATGPAASK
jgi:hypothetical protein